MKTPQRIGEEVAGALAERMEKNVSLALQFAGVRDDTTAAIAAERQRADALAEALRVLLDIANGFTPSDNYVCRNEIIKAATTLAAYDAEAK